MENAKQLETLQELQKKIQAKATYCSINAFKNNVIVIILLSKQRGQTNE